MRLTFDDYVIDVARRELWRADELVAIEPQVFDLLLYFARNPDRVVGRDELLQVIWEGRLVSESAIANRINAVRRAIGDSGDAQRLIRTVPRKGFRFIGPVEEYSTPCTPKLRVLRDGRRQGVPFVFAAVAASALLGAAIAAFVLWPGRGAPWASAILGRTPIAASSPKSVGLPRLTLAVLPITGLGDNADRPNLSTGITENLTAELSRYSDLLVTSRGTVSAHLQWPIDAKELGRELGVSYIIDGTVEQIAGQIRFATRLVDTETGTYFWADRYDLPVSDPLDVEDEIVGRTVNRVRRALTFREANRTRPDFDVAQLIWRGRVLAWNATSRKTEADAAQIFERAAELAPYDRAAKFGLASTLALSAQGLFDVSDKSRLQRASDVIDTALSAWPDDAASYYIKGQVLGIQGRCTDAIGEFERAITINHYYTAAYARLAYCKFMTGNFEDVMPIEQRALRFAPMAANLGMYYRQIGMAEMFKSHFDQAILWLEKSRTAETTQRSEWAYEIYSELAAAYALDGDTSRAAEALAEARKSDKFPASIEQMCRHSPLCKDPKIRARAEATYFKGLRLAGLPEN